MNIRSFWHRGVNRIYTEAVQRWNEKEFTAQDGQTLRYMFFPCKKSDILVVGFQACNDAGPRYNQVRTLKECGVNRLLIKDDFGPRQLGVYYLGCKENHAVETAVFELIDRCIAESRTLFKYIVFSGSSKGGYAALNFGIHYPNSVMVVAAPQYFLGNYLDSEKFRPTLEEILGGPVTEKNKNALNHRLKQRIREDTAAKTQRVYILTTQIKSTPTKSTLGRCWKI